MADHDPLCPWLTWPEHNQSCRCDLIARVRTDQSEKERTLHMTDTYLAVANAADSFSLQRRTAACAAQQDAPGDPQVWAYEHRYQCASAPGWGAAWASAEASGNPDPGADPAVITDGQILTEVQAQLGTITTAEAQAQRSAQDEARRAAVG